MKKGIFSISTGLKYSFNSISIPEMKNTSSSSIWIAAPITKMGLKLSELWVSAFFSETSKSDTEKMTVGVLKKSPQHT